MRRRKPTLTVQEVKDRLDYDPATGIFRWRIGCKHGPRAAAGSAAGTTKPDDGHRQIKIAGLSYYTARLAVVIMRGYWPTQDVDHRNGKRDDDRWENLRECSFMENAKNRGAGKNNTTGQVGVYWYKRQGRWCASIDSDGRRFNLGYFDRYADAVAARLAAEDKHYGQFSRSAAAITMPVPASPPTAAEFS